MTNLVLDDNFQRTHRPFAAKDIRPLQAGRVLMSFGANLLIVDKGKMSFGAKGLSHCKWLMLFFANVLSVDKGKMSFLAEGLSDGRVRMSFTANTLTLCHLEEPFGTRY